MRISRTPVTLSPRRKLLLYAATGLLWVTGVIYIGVQYSSQGAYEITPVGHWVQSVSMKIHGAVAMIFLMIFGGLLLDHVPTGWRKNEKRITGVWQVVVCSLLILTGWGLYYLGNEEWRSRTRWLHVAVGLFLPLLILVHVKFAGIKKRD